MNPKIKKHNKPMKDLGYMNGWKYTIKNNRVVYDPKDHPEYCKCREQDHVLQEIYHDNRGTDAEYICPLCQIKWHVDSSD